MFAEERRQEIMRIIKKDKNILAKDLTEAFGVTNETIRKDLIILEKEGKLIKTYGGAYVHDGAINDVPIVLRESTMILKKDIIGRACAKLINHGDTVIFDGSTTVLHIAKNICNMENLTVITNSLRIAEIFSTKKNIRLVLTGGTLDTRSLCFMGDDAKNILKQYYADICFVSCRGLSITGEITDSIEEQAVMRRLMLNCSHKKVMVADLSKFGLRKFKKICNFEDIDVLAVDDVPDENWKCEIKNKGIKLIQIGG